MHTYPFAFVNDHIIPNIGDKRALIDTGAPFSIGNSPILILGETYECVDNFAGANISQLIEDVGTHIDFLIGGNILSESAFRIDFEKNEITFFETEEENPDVGDDTLSMELFSDIPVITYVSSGKEMKGFLDTGARITYLPEHMLNGKDQISELEDFYPGYGKFTTPVVMKELQLGNKKTLTLCGTLPEVLAQSLLMFGVDSIVGMDLLKQFKTITFNYTAKTISTTDYD